MLVQLGNIGYNTDANLDEETFKATFRGKINIDINQAWKIVKPHYKAPKEEKPKNRRKKEVEIETEKDSE